MLGEFLDIFSRNVSTTPANVTPFTFEVNDKEWQHHRNQTKARRYDSSKAEIMAETIKKLLAAGVIQPSRANYHSHGFVVPKSMEGQWRFVVDFKNLNKISSAERWPIPNIEALLRRIGDKHARFFNIMDLTSGYFRAQQYANIQPL